MRSAQLAWCNFVLSKGGDKRSHWPRFLQQQQVIDMTKKKEMTGAERKASILDAGAKLAAKHGASNVTRRMVAKQAGVSEALVSA